MSLRINFYRVDMGANERVHVLLVTTPVSVGFPWQTWKVVPWRDCSSDCREVRKLLYSRQEKVKKFVFWNECIASKFARIVFVHDLWVGCHVDVQGGGLQRTEGVIDSLLMITEWHQTSHKLRSLLIYIYVWLIYCVHVDLDLRNNS